MYHFGIILPLWLCLFYDPHLYFNQGTNCSFITHTSFNILTLTRSYYHVCLASLTIALMRRHFSSAVRRIAWMDYFTSKACPAFGVSLPHLLPWSGLEFIWLTVHQLALSVVAPWRTLCIIRGNALELVCLGVCISWACLYTSLEVLSRFIKLAYIPLVLVGNCPEVVYILH